MSHDRSPTPHDDVRSVLTELLRLYDWRFELASRERAVANDEFHKETKALLNQYGREKKAAWEAARMALSVPSETAPPQDWKDIFVEYGEKGRSQAWLYEQIAAHSRRATSSAGTTIMGVELLKAVDELTVERADELGEWADQQARIDGKMPQDMHRKAFQHRMRGLAAACKIAREYLRARSTPSSARTATTEALVAILRPIKDYDGGDLNLLLDKMKAAVKAHSAVIDSLPFTIASPDRNTHQK